MDTKSKKPDISGIPSKPGTYLMKDRGNKVLYVGKAVNLKSRVRSYFNMAAKHSSRIALMVSLVDHVDFITTDNEVEALILENNLIKKEKPRFNIMLKDDKTYPYLKLTNEKFPRLLVVRRLLKDGAQYFGPYVSATAVRLVKKTIHRIFALRQSRDNLDSVLPRRPCLNFQMKRCLGPCSGEISIEEYGEVVKMTVGFLKGKEREITTIIKRDMKAASDGYEFEKAALLRNQLKAIQLVQETQKIDTASEKIDEDYIAAIVEGGIGIVRVMMVRGGKLVGDQNFEFKKADDPEELIEAFIQQFYNSAFVVPSKIILNVFPDEMEVVRSWLQKLRGHKVETIRPLCGRKMKILEMVIENAKLKLLNFTSSEESRKEALNEIKNLLNMAEWPTVLECIDISNISGIAGVGSLVSFFNGEPKKSEYKRFKLKITGSDDYAMIAEVVERRFKRLSIENKKFPDLLVIDGGKGQVNAAWEIVKRYNPKQAVLGIAKGKERERSETDIFHLAGVKGPIEFPIKSSGRFLLQRLRDESHRFAIKYHRQKRDETAFRNEVDSVKGFGAKRKKILISKYGSLKAAKFVDVDELAEVLSINRQLAGEILEKL